jgi:CRISPR/Cas system-associated exonuclease Cas4 (RecB family)
VLTCYLQCPLQYYFQYEKGLAWKLTPSAVAFGSSVHNAVERIHNSLKDGSPMSETEAVSGFVSHWTDNVQKNDIQWKTPEESGEMLVKGQDLIGMYYNEVKDEKPTEVELQFRLPLIDPRTGLFVQSRDMVGKIDVIFTDDTIVEVKTYSRSPVQQEVDQNLQLTLYSWAYRMLYGRSEKGIKIINLVKTKDPKVMIIETERSERDHSWLIAIIYQVIRGIEQKLFYPNPIGGFGCFNCQYQEQCREPRGV